MKNLDWIKRHDLNNPDNQDWVLAVSKSLGFTEQTCHVSYFESEACLCVRHNVSIYYIILDWENECLRIVEELNLKNKHNKYHKHSRIFTGEIAYWQAIKFIRGLRIRLS